MAERRPEPFAVTAKNLADLLKALPKAVANKIKHAIETDWREAPQEKRRQEETFRQLEGNLPMGYTLIYESSDGKMCLYRDKEGHLLAADTSKFV